MRSPLPAPAAALGHLPAHLDAPEPLEAVKGGVEHLVGPLEASPGELADALAGRVAAAVSTTGRHLWRGPCSVVVGSDGNESPAGGRQENPLVRVAGNGREVP